MFQSIIDDHLKTARLEIESALSDFCTLFRQNPKELKLIVENWESFKDLLRVPDGIEGIGVEYQPHMWGPGLTDQIGWIKWFIQHEMLDDGEPRVLYYRRPIRTLDGPAWISAPPSQATGCSIIRYDACDNVGDLLDKSLYLTVDRLREAILFQKKRELAREAVRSWRGSEGSSSNQEKISGINEGGRLREVLHLTEARFFQTTPADNPS